jgi:GxxExxY protein
MESMEIHGGKKMQPYKELSSMVIGCAIEVHRHLGPGLLESTYEQCLAHELRLNNIPFRLQYPLPVEYKGLQLDCGYRVDLFIDDKIILELKSVDELHGIHQAQILTYMKLAGIRQGYLVNFNVKRLKDGLKSFLL